MCLLKEFLQKPQELSTNRLPGSEKGRGDAQGGWVGGDGGNDISLQYSLAAGNLRLCSSDWFHTIATSEYWQLERFCLSRAK